MVKSFDEIMALVANFESAVKKKKKAAMIEKYYELRYEIGILCNELERRQDIIEHLSNKCYQGATEYETVSDIFVPKMPRSMTGDDLEEFYKRSIDKNETQ